jgi:multiple sugar transport system substrate-binding protein
MPEIVFRSPSTRIGNKENTMAEHARSGLLQKAGTVLGTVALSLLLAGTASAKTNVKMIVAHFSDQTMKTFQAAADRFEAKNPDIHIILEEVSWDNLQQRLATDIAGGTAPDLSIVASRWLYDYTSQDIAEPLDHYMTPEFKSQFLGNLLSPQVINSKLWALPIDFGVRTIYYNKDIFAKAGITAPPTTWDELRTDAQRIKAAGSYGFGLQGKEIETDTYWYFPLWSFGGQVVENGRSGIASDAGIKAANFYKSMIDDGLTQPSPTGSNRQDIETLFKQGKLGMLVTGTWLRGQLNTEVPSLHYGIAPMPRAVTEATYCGIDSIMMFKSSKVKDAAWKFMQEALFAPETRIEFSTTEGFLPVTKAELDAPQMKQDPSVTMLMSMLPYVHYAPQIPNWAQVSDITSATLQRIYLGQVDVKPGLTQAAASIDQQIKP